MADGDALGFRHIEAIRAVLMTGSVTAAAGQLLVTQPAVSNTLAKLRTEQRIAIESVTQQYDLPTREELNTVHRRLRDLKAELRRVNARLEAAEKGGAPRKAASKSTTNRKGK